MTITTHFKVAASAGLMLAAPAALANNGGGPAHPGVRSSQSLPSLNATRDYRPSQDQIDRTASAAANPPYCSGTKNGIYRDKGEKNGNGKALTCARSPG